MFGNNPFHAEFMRMHQRLCHCEAFIRLTAVLVIALACGILDCTAEAAPRARRPSAAQTKKMKEQMQYAQQEMMRYQTAVMAKEREVYLSYDENGNGHLEGAEKAKYDKFVHAAQTGKVPNPLATIVPLGQGPKLGKNNSTKK